MMNEPVNKMELSEQNAILQKAKITKGDLPELLEKKGISYDALRYASCDDPDLFSRDSLRRVFSDPGETNHVSRWNLCGGDPYFRRNLCDGGKYDQGALHGCVKRGTWHPCKDPRE